MSDADRSVPSKPFSDFLAKRFGYASWPPPIGTLPPNYPRTNWEIEITMAVIDFMDVLSAKVLGERLE